MPHDGAPELDVFAAAAERRRAIAAEFFGRPIDDVIGVVDASGAGGFCETDQRWTLTFRFHCWKVAGGSFRARPLSVQMTASRELFDSLWKLVEAYAVVRVRARVVEDSVSGTPQAELVEYLGPNHTDAELNQAAADLQVPVIFCDEQFGSLWLDRRLNQYTGHAAWHGKAIWLNLNLDDLGAVEPALQLARSLWTNQVQWRKRIEDYAVQELLPLKNKNWRDDDEAELTAGQFKARMTLESITVGPDGSIEFWHNDGDLFWGHAIQIGGSLSEGPMRADIPG